VCRSTGAFFNALPLHHARKPVQRSTRTTSNTAIRTSNKTSRDNLIAYFFGAQFITTVMGDAPSASSGMV
jgi:hypothetical protein